MVKEVQMANMDDIDADANIDEGADSAALEHLNGGIVGGLETVGLSTASLRLRASTTSKPKVSVLKMPFNGDQIEAGPQSGSTDDGGPTIHLLSTAALEVANQKRMSRSELLLDDENMDLFSFEQKLKGTIIADIDLVNYPQLLLQSAIDEISRMKQDLLDYADEQGITSAEEVGSARYRKFKELLGMINQEVALYQQFLHVDDKRLDLANIINQNGNDSDDNGFMTTSPRAPPADSQSENSSRNPLESERRQNRRLSVSSSGSIPSKSSNRLSLNASTLGLSNSPSMTFGSLRRDFRLSMSAARSPPLATDIFRWTNLNQLSDLLHSEGMVQKVGQPTVFCVSAGIAIGTSRSLVLIFDFAQNLKVTLGDSVNAIDYGPVTALTMAAEKNRLASGYAQGVICVWDIQKRTTIKIIPPLVKGPRPTSLDGHALRSPLIHLSFIGSRNDLVSADSEGSAFYHTFLPLAVLSTVSTTRIYGQPGNRRSLVFGLAVLPKAQVKHFSDSLRMIAMATSQRLSIICMKPKPYVAYKLSWRKRQDTTGILSASLAWLPSLTAQETGVTTNPLLAVTYGPTVAIIEVETDTSSKHEQAVYSLRGEWVGQENIVSVRWLNDHLLSLLTREEVLLVFDVNSMSPLETCDLRNRHILGHNYFPPLADDPSRQFEIAYYHSIQTYKGRLFAMGQNSFEVASPLSWSDRLSQLSKTGRFEDAIVLGVELFEGIIQKAVVGIPQDESLRRAIVGSAVADLVSAYASRILANCPTESPLTAENGMVAARVCINTAIRINREDILFNDVYDNFADAGLELVFFQTLEPFVLADQITGLNNPGIIQVFIATFVKQGWFARLEQLILHLDAGCLDIHQVISICKEKNLYSAIIHVYNKAMKDFVTPILELLTVVRDVLFERSKNDADLHFLNELESRCYTLYVYLAYVLTGKTFPVGFLIKREALQAKTDIYNFLCSEQHVIWPPGSANPPLELGDGKYPYLRLLLQYDSGELCKVFGAAFEDVSLNGEIRLRNGHATDGKVRFADEHSEVTRQMIIDTLLELVGDASSGGDLLPEGKKTPVYSFVARACTKYPMYIKLETARLDRLMNMLIMSDDQDSHDERQVALLSLVALPALTRAESERAALLKTLEEHKFFRVAEMLYRADELYDKVFLCYLRDQNRRHEAFICLRGLFSSDTLTYAHIWDIKKAFMESLQLLVEINARETASIVMSFFPSDNSDVVRILEPYPQALYKYLQGLLDAGADTSKSPERRPSHLRRNRTLEFGQSTFPQSSSSFDVAVNQFSPELFSRYIELMVEFNPSNLLRFLTILSERLERDPYDFEKVFQLCKGKEILFDASLWLLERSSQFKEALDQLLGRIKTEFKRCIGSESEAFQPDFRRIGVYLLETADFCVRSSRRLDTAESEDLWFILLDEVISWRNQANEDPHLSSASQSAVMEFATFEIKELMLRMIGHVDLPRMLERLLAKSEAKVQLGDYREMLSSLLKSSVLEVEILTAANTSLSRDIHEMHATYTRGTKSAIMPLNIVCAICRRQLAEQPVEQAEAADTYIVAFQCQHSFHGLCLRSEIQAGAPTVGNALKKLDEPWKAGLAWCVICEASNKNGARSEKKRILDVVNTIAIDNKGKQPHILELADTKPVVSPLKNVDMLQTAVDLAPWASAIYHTFDVYENDQGDVIDMNDDAGEVTEGHSSTLLYGSNDSINTFSQLHRQTLPAHILRLVPDTQQSKLALSPPTPTS